MEGMFHQLVWKVKIVLRIEIELNKESIRIGFKTALARDISRSLIERKKA